MIGGVEPAVATSWPTIRWVISYPMLILLGGHASWTGAQPRRPGPMGPEGIEPVAPRPRGGRVGVGGWGQVGRPTGRGVVGSEVVALRGLLVLVVVAGGLGGFQRGSEERRVGKE